MVRSWIWVAAACAAFTGCAQLGPAPVEPKPPAAQAPVSPPEERAPREARSERPQPRASSTRSQRGRISFYGEGFAGKRTASGEPFDPERPTMAHRTLPFGTRVRVTNLENQRSVEVVVNDRGPAIPGRIADLSAAAARQIGMAVDGVVDALLEVVETAKTR